VLYINTFSPVLNNVTLTGGLAKSYGGVYITGACTPVFLHCYFYDNQSSNYGSTVGIADNGGGSLLMVGGSMAINLDAGGVLYIGPLGKAVLVNVSIVNNKEVPVYGTGDGTFINCGITGNRWSDTGGTPSRPNLISTGAFYNSVIKNNKFNTSPGTITYAAGVSFTNTIAENKTVDGSNVITDGSLIDRGANAYYPLTPGGAWNTGGTRRRRSLTICLRRR
jgi:hypothetical protein